MNEKDVVQYEDDEIDLRDLWKTTIKHKKFIIIFTLTVTLIATIWSFVKTPIYEVKSNVQIGFIGNTLIDSSASILKKTKIIFNVDDKIQTKNKFISKVSSIAANKKLKNFIEIKTQAITNDKALKKNKEVTEYLQKTYAQKINQYISNKKNQIKNIRQRINNLNTFEKKNIQIQIKILKTQSIAKINEKINFIKNIKIPALYAKIKFYTNNLKKYNVAINNIYKNNNNNKDSTTTILSSIQMVNYQNLILNLENKIEDLKVEIKKNYKETIPNLQRKRENIKNDNIRKLEHRLTIDLPNKKKQLQKQIEQLKFNMSAQNIQNFHVVGHYIVHDYPVKPKKKLIIIVAFITGLILAIFMVLFLEFTKSTKEEEARK